jgi:hypothetical protein
MQDPRDQIIHETKVLLYRWDAECDLDEINIAKAVMLGINDWLEREVAEFDFEIEFEEEEDE